MSMIDLNNLTPEAIEQLKGILGSTGGVNRSPIWRPLRDMRAPTTSKGRLNRPHFEWSAEEPPEGTVIPPFPRLFWDASGVEYRIESEADLHRVRADWTPYPPTAAPLDAATRLQMELDALSPEDRAFVLEAQRTQRLNRLQDQLSKLSDRELASVTSTPQATAPVTAEETEKRGPGRPKKIA